LRWTLVCSFAGSGDAAIVKRLLSLPIMEKSYIDVQDSRGLGPLHIAARVCPRCHEGKPEGDVRGGVREAWTECKLHSSAFCAFSALRCACAACEIHCELPPPLREEVYVHLQV
jgi:hypothetical protein